MLELHPVAILCWNHTCTGKKLLFTWRLLREDISAIQCWMHENKLTLNALKMEFILIASKPRLKEIEETCCIEVHGEIIYRAPYLKSLGF